MQHIRQRTRQRIKHPSSALDLVAAKFAWDVSDLTPASGGRSELWVLHFGKGRERARPPDKLWGSYKNGVRNLPLTAAALQWNSDSSDVNVYWSLLPAIS